MFVSKFLCGLMFLFPLGLLYLGDKSLGHLVTLRLAFRNCQTVFHSGCSILHSYPAVYEGSSFSAYSPTLAIICCYLRILNEIEKIKVYYKTEHNRN